MIFYWDDWNKNHVPRHGVSIEEAELVVRAAEPPYPEYVDGGKYRIIGRSDSGKLIQVVYTYVSTDRMDYEQMSYNDLLKLEKDSGPYIYVIHARDLTDSEKRRYRKRTR